VRFNVLGALAVETGDGPVTIPGRKPRALLATLLAHANQFVTADFLVEVLWQGDPPDGARTTLRGHVLVLRRSLGQEPGVEGACRLATEAGGYRLKVGTGELDAEEFTALVDQARGERADGRLEAAASSLRSALALWRGAALCDVPLTWLQHTFVVRLESQRLSALTEYMDVSLALERHDAVLPELEELVALHPLHEGFRAQLMQALFLSGRQSDALRTYREAHDRLVEEAGLTPTAHLQDAQSAVLRGDASQRTSPGDNGTRQPPAPCELPPVVPDFVGRQDVRTEAERYAVGAGPSERAHARTVVFTGPPGVGKSSVAVEVAHAMKGRFPDGQLYVPFEAVSEAASGHEALRRSLEALGVPGGEVSSGPGDLERLYRRATAGRRLLLLLDDVPDEAAVKALMPSGEDSLVIITTRRPLPGLGGVHHVPLRGLSETEGVAFLTGTLGRDEARGGGHDLSRLTGLCDGLPLALRAAVASIRNRPAGAIGRFVARLEGSGDPLEELDGGGLAVTAAIATAVGACRPEEQSLLASLVATGAGPVGPVEAARMLETDVTSAEEAMHGLWRQALVDARPAGHQVTNLARAYVKRSLVDPAEPDGVRGPRSSLTG
jgi:DNA-binding SARP family transcriptional activator